MGYTRQGLPRNSCCRPALLQRQTRPCMMATLSHAPSHPAVHMPSLPGLQWQPSTMATCCRRAWCPRRWRGGCCRSAWRWRWRPRARRQACPCSCPCQAGDNPSCLQVHQLALQQCVACVLRCKAWTDRTQALCHSLQTLAPLPLPPRPWPAAAWHAPTLACCRTRLLLPPIPQIRPRYEFTRKEGPGGKLEVRRVAGL